MSVSILLVSLTLISAFLICWQRLKKYSTINSIPGPTSLELIKFMSTASHKDVYNYLLELPKKYGPVVRLWVKPFRPALLVTDPKYFEHILTAREHLLKTDAYRLLHPLAGDGLATNPNIDIWRKERRLVSPCFGQKAVSQYPHVYQEHINMLANVIKAKGNEAVDVQSLLQRYTLGIIFELLARENISTNEDGVSAYFQSLRSFFSVYLERAYSSFKNNDFLFAFCKSYRTYVDSGKYVHDYIVKIVKTQITMRNNKNGLGHEKDFLDLLVESGLSYDRLISHMKTFIIAGSDTTAQAISFALYELAKKPDVQQKIYDEYITLLTTEDKYTPNFEDIQKLKYTETVVRETMRLHPSVPIIQRILTSPVTIDDTVIPSDTDIYFSIIGTHNSSSWYDNPQVFDPDRFSPENSSKIQSSSYIPFSLGPRDCIGQRIAMTQMKFTISYIIRHFELYPVIPECKLDIVGDMTLTSLNGIPVIFKERK